MYTPQLLFFHLVFITPEQYHIPISYNGVNLGDGFLKLIGALKFTGPIVDTRVSSVVILSATYQLSDMEIKHLEEALKLVADEIEDDKLKSLTKVNLIFTENGNIMLEMDNKQDLGKQIRCCVYPIQRIRDKGYSKLHLLQIFIIKY